MPERGLPKSGTPRRGEHLPFDVRRPLRRSELAWPMDREFYATCTLGLEPALSAELEVLGASDISQGKGGVRFHGTLELGYRANLWLRSATRVQELLVYDEIRDQDDLYEVCADLDWERLMRVDQTLAVDAVVRDSCFTHSGFAAQRVKDAIVDTFWRDYGRRPSVDTRNPDLPLHLMLKQDQLSLSRNLSGASLHKRGYRPIQVKSPINEASAAGLLLLAGVDVTQPLVDPMCGSGTFLIEAAWIATGRAPGLSRSFAFERWPDFDAALYERLQREARAAIRTDVELSLCGADRHPGAIDLARRAARAAGVAAHIRFVEADLLHFTPDPRPRTIITNPPWGERLDEETEQSWRDLGAFLHRQAQGATAYVLCGNQDLTRYLGLKASRRHPVWTGRIECRLLRYDVFAKPVDGEAPTAPLEPAELAELAEPAAPTTEPDASAEPVAPAESGDGEGPVDPAQPSA